MKVLELKALRGPNFWSIKRGNLIQMTLDLEDLENFPTNKINGFSERLQSLFPSLYEHRCSEGKPGGFFERVKRGTWMGHVIEHIALEIQSLAGINLGFGQTRGTGKAGIYHVVFEYAEEKEGFYAAQAAVRIAETLIDGGSYDLETDIFEIKKLWMQERLGPSTNAIVQEAKKRGIPAFRLDEEAYVQLGYGCRQKRIEATLTGCSSSIAVDIACDKHRTKKILTGAYIPVPQGEIVSSVEKLKEVIDVIGYPIVLKPVDGNHGKGATINVESWEEAVKGFERAKLYSEKIIVEKYVKGKDFRVLVINNKFVAASLRTPASVSGDGHHTIRELIEIVNCDPRRGKGHDNVLTCIEINDVCLEYLNKQGLNLDSVLSAGRICYLKPTANLSTGGTATDVTDEVHPSNIVLFERAARAIGLDICGVDVMAPDLSHPLIENGGVVLEVNAAPGFRMHFEPNSGTPRNVAQPVIDMLFPEGTDSRIPIVAVTGTNGKTTTTRLMAHMAKAAGFVTGYTTTDGIYIGNELVYKGDCSGPQSAETILKDISVEFAVLETARGGILRSGLAFDQCNTAIVTNVAEDHLGLQGINTIEKLARVKSVVPESVNINGYAILNADDDLVYAMKENVKCKVALFSLFSNSDRIEQHCSQGGIAAYPEEGYLILRVADHIVPIEEMQNIPITFGGKADYNIANVLAAMLAAYTNNIRLSVIRTALQTFVPSSETTPGRANIIELNDCTVMIDYAHNPHGLKALGKFINSFEQSCKVGIITGVGDRRDKDIIALAEEAARIFDEIIIRHDEDMRGRSKEEMDELLTTGIREIDPAKPIQFIGCECDAVEHAILHRKPGSLIVVLVENYVAVTECVLKHQSQALQSLTCLKRAV
ncbi:cyanophycin synthetase [Flavisolibacter ginsengisoli]|jgi:cyanophycin synthetase|uniref:Cyanophycin synthetase n=1 Tax=Flavisolibacter ginsengisoli DSM 18119 TaxID=1121884 RepID=A0A1M4SAL0_9BACT|nr:cyanophycin synthetase [Flavisolibacter ginsengisoli]SHE29246.1 cyanophycin synthetase [Flavisolibacter ginsengisoli DSM 18119]